MVLLTFSPARLLPHSYTEILAETWLYKKIYKTEMKFWAGGAAEKKTPNCHKYATLWSVFSTFCVHKIFL